MLNHTRSFGFACLIVVVAGCSGPDVFDLLPDASTTKGNTGDAGPVTCASAGDCTESDNAVCDPVTHACVACVSDANCETGKHCKTTTHQCVSCVDSSQCGDPNLACDTAKNECVAACTGNSQCAAPTPYCSSGGFCVQCASNLDCANGENPYCSPESYCVECLTDSQCSGGRCNADHSCG